MLHHQELELLDDDANIFKLIGPILVKQDPLEAKSNVSKRLDLIKGELDRLDSQLKRLDDKQSKRQHTVSAGQLHKSYILYDRKLMSLHAHADEAGRRTSSAIHARHKPGNWTMNKQTDLQLSCWIKNERLSALCRAGEQLLGRQPAMLAWRSLCYAGFAASGLPVPETDSRNLADVKANNNTI